MRILSLAAILTWLALGTAPTFAADPTQGEPMCRRFADAGAEPNELAPRLGRLCVRLVDSHESAGGMSEEEVSAATRLGNYLAVLGELDLRRNGLGSGQAAKATTETARYLIADRMGLLDIADELAPLPPKTAALN